MTGLHPYAHPHQRAATVVLAILGVLAAWSTYMVLTALQWTVPWWIDAPAVLGWYGLLAAWFDRMAWRWSGLRRIHGIPDLSGTYSVSIRSSHDDHQRPIEGTATITQRWSQLAIRLTFGESTSMSSGASLALTPEGGVRLTYFYDNDPRPAAPATMQRHGGTAAVEFDHAQRGTGTYYSGRGRVNFGEITFEPVRIGA